MATSQRKVTDSMKKRVAAQQEFKCANSQAIPVVEGYSCPFKGRLFDESGYDIDHIKEFADTQDDSLSNLQALCINCHRVKTQRFNSTRPRRTNAKKVPTQQSTDENGCVDMDIASASAIAIDEPPKKPAKEKQPATPVFNKFKIQLKIKNGIEKVHLKDYGAWRIIEQWASQKAGNAATFPIGSSHSILSLLNALQSLRDSCESTTDFSGRVRPARPVWNAIDTYVINLSNNAERCDVCKEVLTELSQIM